MSRRTKNPSVPVAGSGREWPDTAAFLVVGLTMSASCGGILLVAGIATFSTLAPNRPGWQVAAAATATAMLLSGLIGWYAHPMVARVAGRLVGASGQR
jgi:hypothetical protein